MIPLERLTRAQLQGVLDELEMPYDAPEYPYALNAPAADLIKVIKAADDAGRIDDGLINDAISEVLDGCREIDPEYEDRKRTVEEVSRICGGLTSSEVADIMNGD